MKKLILITMIASILIANAVFADCAVGNVSIGNNTLWSVNCSEQMGMVDNHLNSNAIEASVRIPTIEKVSVLQDFNLNTLLKKSSTNKVNILQGIGIVSNSIKGLHIWQQLSTDVSEALSISQSIGQNNINAPSSNSNPTIAEQGGFQIDYGIVILIVIITLIAMFIFKNDIRDKLLEKLAVPEEPVVEPVQATDIKEDENVQDKEV